MKTDTNQLVDEQDDNKKRVHLRSVETERCEDLCHRIIVQYNKGDTFAQLGRNLKQQLAKMQFEYKGIKSDSYFRKD